MAVYAQGAAVSPGVGKRADDLFVRAAEHRRCDSAGGDADEQDMIQTDAVVTILQRQDALDLMGFDHRLQDIGDRERFLSGASEIIGQGENAAKIVRRVTPLGGEPGIVKSSQRIIAPILNAACTGSNCQSVPGTRAPLASIAPGTTGPRSLVHSEKRSASRPQPRVSSKL